MLEPLVSPWSCIGAMVGLLAAVVVHWLVPTDIDIAQLGGWLVALGWATGLGWDLVFSERRKKK